VGRTFNGKGFRLREHVDRLYRSLKYVRLDPGLSRQEMLAISEEAVSRDAQFLPEVGDFLIWQLVTRGPGRWAHSAGPPTVCVEVRPISFHRFAPYTKTGVNGVIVGTRSHSSPTVDPKLKHHSRMNFNLAELEANDVDPGAWPILKDRHGNITEGTSYSVFLVTNGTIRTANDSTVLQSVSRLTVIDLAKSLGIPIVEEELQPYDLYTADEVFFAGTSYCVLPVSRVDRRLIADGKPGPMVGRLWAAWGEMVGVDIVAQAIQYAGA